MKTPTPNIFTTILKNIVTWIKDRAPTFLAIGAIFRSFYKSRIAAKDSEIRTLKTGAEYGKAKKRVTDQMDGKSDRDVINDAIGEGKRLGKANKPKPDS